LLHPILTVDFDWSIDMMEVGGEPSDGVGRCVTHFGLGSCDVAFSGSLDLSLFVSGCRPSELAFVASQLDIVDSGTFTFMSWSFSLHCSYHNLNSYQLQPFSLATFVNNSPNALKVS